MVLPTFLLLDLRFKGKGIGVVALICIKSASKIYYTEMIDDSSQGIWGRGCGGVCLRCGPVRLGQLKKCRIVLGMVSWPLSKGPGGAFFLDWLWLCDESLPHRRALHIPVQIWRENSNWSSCQQFA